MGQLFADNPSHSLLYNASLSKLANWSYPIDAILDEYPYEQWLSHWNIEPFLKRTSIHRYIRKSKHKSQNVDFSQFTLYGKWTGHYTHPPTALVFAHMAFYRSWSFFLHIREPIDRMWSVQQHWHQYKGNAQQIRAAAAENIWEKYEKSLILQQIV